MWGKGGIWIGPPTPVKNWSKGFINNPMARGKKGEGGGSIFWASKILIIAIIAQVWALQSWYNNQCCKVGNLTYTKHTAWHRQGAVLADYLVDIALILTKKKDNLI